jgi:translocator protein
MIRAKSFLALLGWIALTFCAPALGTWSLGNSAGFYQSLQRPGWSPPAWVFGPVWTLLYTLMAVAAWLVWKRGGWRAQRTPLTLYVVQLALNAAWTPIFFGAHRIGLAAVEIVVLWLAIVLTLSAFARASRGAAWLLAPYLAWVSFAAALNFALWQMNRA